MKDAWIWKIKNIKLLQYIIAVLHFFIIQLQQGDLYKEPIPGFQS